MTLRIAVIGGGIGGLTAAVALRQAGFEVDVYEQAPELTEIGGDGIHSAVHERGRAYLPATIGRLVKALGAPININVRAGSPSVAELEALGVACASTASQLALMAMSIARQVADELRATGRFDALAAMTQADAQRLFTGL